MARTSMAWKTAALWLVAIFALALVLRVAFNVEPSYAEDDDRYVYSGNDPYYHDRTVGHIIEEGESLVHDPAINYPHGGPNANPPLYDWTTALLAGVLHDGGMETAKATSLALNLMVAVWGALTVFPVYMIGRELFSRLGGLFSAFLIAVAPPHITRAIWGFADHDATTVFFITLALAFFIKALVTMERREYVADWRDGSAARAGLAKAFEANRVPVLWATLAGLCLAATALVWKGYPYVLAILAFGVFLQLLLDHARNRDSSVVFGLYLIPLVLVVLIPWPYYLQFPSFLATTIMPSLYVLAGVLIVGLVLVPTRQLPSIVVFPALALAGIVGLLALRFIFTDMWLTVTTGLGYFAQSKLYTTIGEAQRPGLGTIAANFGFFTFLLAFWTFGRVLKRGYKGDAAHLVMAVWSVVALFMAFAASRFIMNASPVFAVLGGVAIATLATNLGLGKQQMYGQKKAFSWKRAAGVGGIALLLVVPNLWIGVDAAMTSEFEQEHGLVKNDASVANRFGAFGIDFSIKDNGWMEAMRELAKRDTCRSDPLAICQPGDPDYQPIADRPAQVAWWDYGHWTTNLGRHPTVADPFQNHYNLAGRFLASESEENGILWLTILLIDGDWEKDGPGYSGGVRSLLGGLDPGLGLGRLGLGDHAFSTLKPHLSGEETFRFYEDVMEATDRRVEYFGTDARMMPSQTDYSIFYAPVYLSDKNPEEFVKRTCVSTSNQNFKLTFHEYEMNERNVSVRVAEPSWVDSTGAKYQLANTGQLQSQAYSVSNPAADPVDCIRLVETTARFQNTMFAKGFGGFDTRSTSAGDGLSHWRLVAQGTFNVTRLVAILQYYPGVTVEGRVLASDNGPLAGVEVTFRDGHQATHATATTDANGTFSVIAPFSVFNETGGDLTMIVRENGRVIAESTEHQFTLQQARQRDVVSGVEIRVPDVSVSGRVFRDLNSNSTYEADIDELVDGATVTVDGRATVTVDGAYSFDALRAGQHRIVIEKDGFTTVNRTMDLAFDQSAQVRDFALAYAPRQVTFNVTFDGVPQEQVRIQLSGTQNTNVTTDVNGTVTRDLRVGTYTLRINDTFGEGNDTMRWVVTRDFEVAFNAPPQTFEIEVRDEGEAQLP